MLCRNVGVNSSVLTFYAVCLILYHSNSKQSNIEYATCLAVSNLYDTN